MKIVIGNDHSAVEMKKVVVNYLESKNYEVINIGTDTQESVDYPDFGFKVGEMVVAKQADLGIVICGTGIGISIAANKVKGVRCAPCYEERTAILARQHNNANVLALGARIIAEQKAIWIVEAFLEAKFEGDRHLRRTAKLDNYINKK